MAQTNVNVVQRAGVSRRSSFAGGLAILLVLAGLLPILAPTAQAQSGTDFIGYLPWLSNGETIGGQGPWYGVISIQNRSNQLCGIQVYVAGTAENSSQGEWKWTAGISLTNGASRSLSASSISVPSPGGAVRVEAGCEIAISAKEYTPNVRQGQTPWSTGARVVTGYTGLGDGDLAAANATETSDWFLPIVQTNSDWNTFLRVTNFGTMPANVTVDIYPSGNTQGDNGVVLSLTQSVGLASTWTINALAELGVTEFVGFARISADRDVGVIARRVKPGAQMAITNVAVAADGAVNEGNYRTAAPLLFTAYNGWNTGITMANVSAWPAVVTIQYYPTDGSLLRQQTLVIAARSMEYIYTPGTVVEEGFVGSATIVSNLPIVAAVDEVKYETSEALSYMASGAAQQIAGIPIVFREDPANDKHDNSGISIVNLDPVNGQVVLVRLRGRGGEDLLELPLALMIPAGSNTYVYLPFIAGVPAGTNGSALLETTSEAGFIAISNDVNYAVGGDGSVVFMASGNGGVYYVPTPTP